MEKTKHKEFSHEWLIERVDPMIEVFQSVIAELSIMAGDNREHTKNLSDIALLAIYKMIMLVYKEAAPFALMNLQMIFLQSEKENINTQLDANWKKNVDRHKGKSDFSGDHVGP